MVERMGISTKLLLGQDIPFLRVPFNDLSSIFRHTQRSFEKDLNSILVEIFAIVNNSSIPADKNEKVSISGTKNQRQHASPSSSRRLHSLFNTLRKVRANILVMRSLVEKVHLEHLSALDVCFRRVRHVGAAVFANGYFNRNPENSNFTLLTPAFQARILAEYLAFRGGFSRTISMLLEQQRPILDKDKDKDANRISALWQVNEKLHSQLRSIQRALLRGDVEPALEWCCGTQVCAHYICIRIYCVMNFILSDLLFHIFI